MKPTIVLISTFGFLSTISSLARATEYVCPHSVESTQVATSKAEGWTSWPEKLNHLQVVESVSVYSGHPDDGADLVPIARKGKTPQTTWILKNEKNEIWMSCVYSQTYLRLIQKLPAKISKCTIVYQDKGGPSKQVAGLACE